jgi:peptidyl-prolyl cis-trans isomerase D
VSPDERIVVNGVMEGASSSAFVVYNQIFCFLPRSDKKMIRFLQTPGPVKKVLLGGLLTIICVFMVITLVPGFGSNYFGGGANTTRGVVATVDGDSVSTTDVQKAARSMIQQQFRQNMSQAAMLMPYFAQRAAEQLINEKVIIAEARRLGLRATDEDVRDELQHGQYAQVFFPGGNFIGEDAYEEKLQQANLTPQQFEQSVKDEILFNKLRSLVDGGATVTDAEIRTKFEKENTKVKFDYAVLRKDDIEKGLHPTDAELEAYFKQNQAKYNNAIPEKRKISYVLIDKSQLQVPVTAQEIQSYYNDHRDEYRVPDQVNASHILFKTPLPGADGKIDQAGVDAAKNKAEDVLKQLKAGGDFATLAKKYSEDTSSAKNGGSLGWIQHGRFGSPDEDKIVFALPKGGTSDVIPTGSGFDIIHIDDKQDAHVKPLDEVKDQIESQLKQDKIAQTAEGLANGIASDARANGLEKAAAAKKQSVTTTDFFSKADVLPGIGRAPQFNDAVFAAAEKSPPDVAPVPQGFVVYQLQAIQPPATPTLDAIRSRVENDFKNDRSVTLLQQKTQELSDRAKADHDLKKAAKELGAEMKTSDLVLPDGQVPDIGSMSGPAAVAFTLKPGEISGPIDTNADGIVLSVLEKQEPTDQDYAAKRDEIRNSLLQERQNELFGMFVENARTQMEKSGKLKINQEEMKGLTKRPDQQDEGE